MVTQNLVAAAALLISVSTLVYGVLTFRHSESHDYTEELEARFALCRKDREELAADKLRLENEKTALREENFRLMRQLIRANSGGTS